MERTRVIIICTVICCLCLTSINSQQPNYDPNINQDKIYFIEDYPTKQPLTTPWLTPQPFSIQPQANLWQNGRQALPVRPLGANQYPVANQESLITNQRPVPADQSNPREADVEQRRTGNMARGRKVVRFSKTSAALTSFSINLMKLVGLQSTGNTVVSPHSIATLLALLQQGATGATLEQLSRALQMDQQTSSTAMKAYSDDVKDRNSRNKLRTANNIFLANGFTLNPNFRAIALRDFRTDVTPTNFIKADETAQEINRWVAGQTDNMIQNLITPDTLSINTQMVLVNAIYFKGRWDIPFRKQATEPGEFLLSSGKVINADFMQTRRYFKTGMDSHTASKVIVLPFEREEYSLIVILPNTLSTIADTLSMLTAARIEEYLNFPYMEVRLEMPKFSIKADTDLSKVLKEVGLSKLFAGSELSNIGTYEGNMPPQVSSAVHSAALSIDEEGGSAAAATAFAVVALSNDEPSVVFKANRPFLTVLWDNKATLPLFTARIEDPTL